MTTLNQTIIQGVLGIVAFLFIPWLLSEDRKAVNYKDIMITLLMQVCITFFILKVSFIQNIFYFLGKGVHQLKLAVQTGTNFAFGYLGGGAVPFNLKEGASTFIFAFQALPLVIVISGLSMLLFYWGIIPVVTKTLSIVLTRTLKIGGVLGTCAAVKIFLGMIDGPLLIRGYLNHITKSEMFTVMTAGMATTSMSMMAIYASILEKIIPNPASHIFTASVINLFAAINISRIIVPARGQHTDGGMTVPYKFNSALDALSQGACVGINIFLNIIAIIITMLALTSLCNSFLGFFPKINNEVLTLQRILGWGMSPVTWLMGIPWNESFVAGSLLGTKTILNETIAFSDLVNIEPGVLSVRSCLILTYALCGFANLGSMGILVTGLTSLVPDRTKEIMALGGFKVLIAGTLSSCLSATIIGIITN